MDRDDVIIEVRDANLVRRGQLTSDDMSDVLLSPSVVTPGAWSITLPDRVINSSGRVVKHDLCQKLRTPGWGIVATGRGGSHLMSGPLVEAEYNASRSNPLGEWTLMGIDDMHVVEDAVAYGDPTTYSLTTQDTANDVRTDSAESLAMGYINSNVGPAAVVQRINPDIVMAVNHDRGPTRKKSPRFQNLLELVNETLNNTGLWLYAQQVGVQIRVGVYQGLDLTSKIQLDLANDQIDQASYSYKVASAMEVLVAGQEVGTDRNIRRRTGNAGWGRRIEVFKDRRDTNDNTELDQAGDEELAEAAEDTQTFKIVPHISEELDFGIHYKLGDIVKVIIADEPVNVPVTAVNIKIDHRGIDVSAMVGSTSGNEWEDFMDNKQRRLEKRVSRLERSIS